MPITKKEIIESNSHSFTEEELLIIVNIEKLIDSSLKLLFSENDDCAIWINKNEIIALFGENTISIVRINKIMNHVFNIL